MRVRKPFHSFGALARLPAVEKQGRRALTLRCLAGGLDVCAADSPSPYALGRDGRGAAVKSQLFDAPEKVRRWVAGQGRKRRARVHKLKACGLKMKKTKKGIS